MLEILEQLLSDALMIVRFNFYRGIIEIVSEAITRDHKPDD